MSGVSFPVRGDLQDGECVLIINWFQFFLAENDFTLCAGDCKNTYHKDQLKKQFPSAAHIDVYIHPHTGHGLTLEKNATAGYQVSFSYLDKFDL
jgi:hypothetical protein